MTIKEQSFQLVRSEWDTLRERYGVRRLGLFGSCVREEASEGSDVDVLVEFDRFCPSAFPCSPSRACFLTGREAHSHGVANNDLLLAEDIPTVGDLCKAPGYCTAYFGKWHLGG